MAQFKEEDFFKAGFDMSNPAMTAAYKQGVRPAMGDQPVQNNIDPNLRGTLAIRLPGISGVVKFGDWRWQRIWNRVVVTDGFQGELLFFSAGLGVQIANGQRTATAVDTNQPRQGDSGLPVDWGAYIYQVKVGVETVSGTDDTDVGGDGPSPKNFNPDSLDSVQANARTLYEVQRKCLFTVQANDKTRQQGHFTDYPSGAGIYNLGNNDLGFDQPTNGVPSPRDGHQLVVPIQLDANQQYNVIVNFVAAAALFQAQQVNDRTNTSLLMQASLEGLYKVKVI